MPDDENEDSDQGPVTVTEEEKLMLLASIESINLMTEEERNRDFLEVLEEIIREVEAEDPSHIP